MPSSDANGIVGGSSYDSQHYAVEYDAAAEYYADLAETHMPGGTPTDHAIATFQLVISSVLSGVFSIILVTWFLNRNVFEIKARSALLVMLSGACMTVSLFLNIVLQRMILFDAPLDMAAFLCLYFFVLVCSTVCYVSRVVRLVLAFNPRARKALPSWLVSEWHHVGIALVLGLASVGFPLYERQKIPDSPYADMLLYVRASDTRWGITITAQVLAVVLWALIWGTDDIFNIARELRVSLVLLLSVTLAGKLAEDYLNVPYSRWFNRSKMGWLTSIVIFYVSVALPILHLLFDPMESPNPKLAAALAKRKEEGGGALALRNREALAVSTTVPYGMPETLPDASSVTWTYEKIARIPGVSAEFDKFSRRGLCQESVLFLKAVAEYQSRGDGGCEPSGSGEDSHDDEYAAFTHIVLTYIVDGAPDEVEMSSEDASAILQVYEAGRWGFYCLNERERRYIFTRAYADVRYLVETNLMSRFLASDGFKAAARLAGTDATPGRASTSPSSGSLEAEEMR